MVGIATWAPRRAGILEKLGEGRLVGCVDGTRLAVDCLDCR